MKNIGLILFDIDGVIRSVENSYRLSLKKTVFKFSGWEPSYLDIDNAKNEGIWNNDWDLSLELIKRRIKKENLNLKIPSREEIVKCFGEFYFGGDPNKDSKYWSGYITNEELLVDKKFSTLNTIPFEEIDMLSIIIIGNSQTTLIDEIFLTPRGYLQN